MASQRKSIDNLIQQLSPQDKDEVLDFILFLIEKKRKKTSSKPLLKWSGALKDMSSQYTSVQLQHQISDWRAGTKE